LLITQLIYASLLFEQSLALVAVILPALPFLTIAFGTLLLFRLPVARAVVVVIPVAIAIAVAAAVPIPIAITPAIPVSIAIAI
jgi:hypothetical protein